MGYMVCTGNYAATNTQKTKEGCKKFSANSLVVVGLLQGRARYHSQNARDAEEEKEGYMVCTGDYVATNTRRIRLQRTQRGPSLM
jgi:hypothetical protein